LTVRPELARSFGSVVEDYVRGRPGWPEEAVAAPGLSPDAHVLDLAAGTGKLTEVLARRFARVTAVEPQEEMRAEIRDGEVLAGSAERIPVPDASIDAVFVAEAFHWFCDPPALREIERVLRPGGTLVLLWNRPRRSSEELPGVHELMERLRVEAGVSAKTHRFYSGEFREVLRSSRFGPLEEAAFDHEQVLDRAGLVSYFLSQSQVASRTGEERAAIRSELERLIPERRYVRPLTAEVYWTISMGALARSFDRTADEYERARPGYAEEALDAVGLPADAVVLDLAAGTGKLTRQLVPRFARVLAVEPLAGMRAVLERVVPEAEALEGTATAIPLEDASVDGVFVGQAFHWFGTAEAVREIARVLRPGGMLAILFNHADAELEPPLPEPVRDTIDALAAARPPERRSQSGLWRAPFPGPFGPFTEASFPNPVEHDREGLLARLASWSSVASLPDDERAGLLARLRELLPEAQYVDPLRTHLSLTTLSEGG
jgi:ubiquinone/menaquinone biosynthesis C-methylase UbiE